MKKGMLKIDKKLFDKGIMKAKFDFEFTNSLEPQRPFYWKGLIFCEIKNF